MRLGAKITHSSQPELNLRTLRRQDTPNLPRLRNEARIASNKPSILQSSFQNESDIGNAIRPVSNSFTISKTSNNQAPNSNEVLNSAGSLSKFEDPINSPSKFPKSLRYSNKKPLEVITESEPHAFKIKNPKELSLKSTTSTQVSNDVLDNTQKLLGLAEVQTTKHGISAFANKIETNSTTNANEGGRLNMTINTEQRTPPPDEMAQVASTKYHTEVQRSFTPSGSRNKFLSNHKNANLPYFDPTKCSSRKNGVVKAYAANTNQGLVRNYNEDRVAIILNIMRPPHYNSQEAWPVCSYFGIYDGHGGTTCADFLRDYLHQYVIRDKNFPANPEQALRNAFAKAEQQFMELAQQAPNEADRSGSCAIVVLIVDDVCYVANLGDSRAVLSLNHGKKIMSLSDDHKPSEEFETTRILAAGGKNIPVTAFLPWCN